MEANCLTPQCVCGEKTCDLDQWGDVNSLQLKLIFQHWNAQSDCSSHFIYGKTRMFNLENNEQPTKGDRMPLLASHITFKWTGLRLQVVGFFSFSCIHKLNIVHVMYYSYIIVLCNVSIRLIAGGGVFSACFYIIPPVSESSRRSAVRSFQWTRVVIFLSPTVSV